ncbi:MAG: hypothetical protein ACREBI_02425 [Nitrosotalea sp.]
MSEEAEQTRLLKEILKWIKISGIKEVKSLLENLLPNDLKKLIYHLSDGTKGTQEIAKTIGGVSHQTVANYWKEWEKSGLGESISAMGGSRFKRSFDLEDFGIKIQITKQNNSQKTEQPETTSAQPEVESHGQ